MEQTLSTKTGNTPGPIMIISSSHPADKEPASQ